MARNGSEWFGMVRNGSERFGTVRNGSERLGTVRNGSERFGTVRRSETISIHRRIGRVGTVRNCFESTRNSELFGGQV